MQRLLCRRPLSALLAVLVLAAAAFLPFAGVASAQTSVCNSDPNCDLAISAPDSVASGQPFTVQVALGVSTEGGFVLLPKNDPCASNVQVTLTVYLDEQEVPRVYIANAKKDVATFTVDGLPSGIEFAQLYADAANGYCSYFEEGRAITVVDVSAGQPIAPCPNDVPCTQATSGSGTAATLFAASGNGSFAAAIDDSFFSTLFAVDGGQGCGDGGPPDPSGVLGYHFSDPSVTKTIILEVSPGLVNKGIGLINVCWSVDGVHWSFLQACSKKVGPPCVAHKNGLPQHGAYIEIDAPAGPTDPFAYEE